MWWLRAISVLHRIPKEACTTWKGNGIGIWGNTLVKSVTSDIDFAPVERKAENLAIRYKELLDKVNDTDVPQSSLSGIHQEIGQLHVTVENLETLKKLRLDFQGVQDIAIDVNEEEDIRDLAREESNSIQSKIETLEFELMKSIIPKENDNVKSVLLEIRAGTGGDEAALFAVDLFNMYQKFASINRWGFEVLSAEETDHGGFKEVIAEVKGGNVYDKLRFESGVHRVQRVPQTESAGRIHTSASSVSILPQVDEVSFTLNESDLKVETFRSGGAGGQSVNTTDSAVRITYIPTGLMISMQDERSQHKNKAKAMKILRAKLYEEQRRQRHENQAAARKSQVGSGDRSERIRTYNYPQGRVTDHRVNITLHQLDLVMNGESLESIIDALEKQHLLGSLEELNK